MRRKDREITNAAEIEKIIRSTSICRIGMIDENMPYVLPMDFGYEDGALYIHGANKGKKIEALQKNNQVCFEITADYEISLAEPPQHSTTFYHSVIGFGKAHFLQNPEEKIHGMNVILKHHGHDSTANNLPEKLIAFTAVIKINIDSMTGKANTHP